MAEPTRIDWEQAIRWIVLIALSLAANQALAAGFNGLWQWFSDLIGPWLAAALLGLTAATLAVFLAQRWGSVRLPRSSALLAMSYGVRMVRYRLRDPLGRTASGVGNERFATLDDFERDDPCRALREQIDFGVHWRDHGTRTSYRVTWLEQTGELIAVGGRGEEGVEVLATIATEDEVERRLERWGHAGFGNAGLRWVRRRAGGLHVPLPPRGQWWWLTDAEPPVPWPSPPPPSVDREVGAYVGDRSEDEESVSIAEPGRPPRPLYQYVDFSPTGFAWGYTGAGPTDLARSLLADRLGYVPSRQVYFRFCDDVVATLAEEFVLTFAEVDRWIDSHRELFAANPRAEPFDPFAAGGRD